MAEKTFYDEIVECLRLTRRNTPAVSVSDEVLKEFMTDMPVRPQAIPEQTPVPDCSDSRSPAGIFCGSCFHGMG